MAIIGICSHLESDKSLLARRISSINSNVTYFALFIHLGRLHLRYLQFWLSHHWHQSWDLVNSSRPRISLSSPLVLQTISTTGCNSTSSCIQQFFMDASFMGWGTNWNNNQIMGQWNTYLQSQHINWLEMEAVRLALLHWGPQWKNQILKVYSDNSTIVSCICKPGIGLSSWRL